MEENKFDKKQKERQAEEQEEIERQQLLAFKSKHVRPKITRTEIQSEPEEPLKKTMKLFVKAGNPPVQDDLDLETWLRKAEESCQRAGNLKTRLENEKLQVLEKMRRMQDEKTNLVTETDSHEDDCDEDVLKGWTMNPGT